MMRRRPLPLSTIFAAPLAILIVSLAGLVAALMGDGLYDWTAWLGLGAPVAVIVWARLRRAA